MKKNIIEQIKDLEKAISFECKYNEKRYIRLRKLYRTKIANLKYNS